MAFAALLTATAVPLLFLLLVRALDLYGTGSPRAVALAFTWGALTVFIASAIYLFLPRWTGVLPGPLVMAPLLEETLKALALLYLVRRPTFTYFVDGAVYGFAVGIGFAVFENYLYIYQNLDAGFGTALGRVLSTNLMHAGAGTIVGVALGLSRFQRFSGRALYLFSGLFLAVLLHAAFNRLVTQNGGSAPFLYAMGVGLSGLAFTALVIHRGLAVEKAWISETLGVTNRVTPAEVSATAELAHVDTLLEPLTRIFGPRKTGQIEELLRLQAQLGILRKTHSRIRDSGRDGAALAAQIERRQAQMEAARRAIGAYTMVSLRLLFPAEGNPLWQRLQTGLALQAENAPQNHAASNLFTMIEERRPRDQPQQNAAE